MSTIVPAWVKEKRHDGVLAILGSEPPADAAPQFIPQANIESIILSEHTVNGMTFAVLVIRQPKETGT